MHQRTKLLKTNIKWVATITLDKRINTSLLQIGAIAVGLLLITRLQLRDVHQIITITIGVETGHHKDQMTATVMHQGSAIIMILEMLVRVVTGDEEVPDGVAQVRKETMMSLVL